MNNKPDKNFILKAGMIAIIYTVLTLVFNGIAYGPVQYRFSEALTILPMFMPEAVPGLAMGCFLSNIFGSYGFADVLFGSLTTLFAAYLTSKIKNKYYAILPPIFLNALVVSIWVSKSSHSSYWINVGAIGFGEFVTAGILGIIIAAYLEKRSNRNTMVIH